MMSKTSDITFAVLTISDSCSEDVSKDRSGPRLVQLLKNSFANAKITAEILPDDRERIQDKLKILSQQTNPTISTIFTTGGTGFAPRDVTPEATKPILDKECPQLSMAIALASLQKTKFAALTRGVCGIAGNTLILNFPGSEKAVIECFEVVRDLLPHALHLINNNLELVRCTHAEIQEGKDFAAVADGAKTFTSHGGHICPHKTGTGKDDDRNSPFPMIPVTEALEIIFTIVKPYQTIKKLLESTVSPVNIPPFRASIKDGYAMKSTGFAGSKKVIRYISAGEEESLLPLDEDECFKINTGAPVPKEADCIIQIEDTKVLKRKKNGDEDLVEILVQPQAGLDIRPIGSDLRKGQLLFPMHDHSPVVIKSIMASIGKNHSFLITPKIAVVSTGSELLDPTQREKPGKIFDSNTTMLKALLEQFDFSCHKTQVIDDDLSTVRKKISELFSQVDFVICSGGVSMGDKDYIKPALEQLGFKIHFGRVNMKPGKPMTFASKDNKYFFGLPGNPVSAFVTFHLFVLPAVRWVSGWERSKCELAKLSVTLANPSIPLDPRPEYVRATITSRQGILYAEITGNQMSSRLQSIIGADVLVQLPGRSTTKAYAIAGDRNTAFILRHDFISKYE